MRRVISISEETRRAPAQTSWPADIQLDGRAFVDQVVTSASFRDNGIDGGHTAGSAWALVDPVAHPFRVWRASGSGPNAYAAAGRSLDAAVFTNGPMMGKRFGANWKMGRRTAMAEVGGWLAAGALLGRWLSRATLRRRLLVSLGGAAVGSIVAWWRAFTRWLPCGTVRSRTGGFEDTRNFDDEGRTHVWFGRRGLEFATYAVGDGDLPADVLEGSGGLIPVLRGGEVTSAHRDFAELRHKRGFVVWGLVPFAEPDSGVLVVLASQHADLDKAAVWLQGIGARDAVATDQRAMIMFGAGRRYWIGPPHLHRQGMQLYGFSCA